MARVRGAAATKELRKQAGSGKFLTLRDGDSYEVAFAGVLKHGDDADADADAEPIGIEVVWKTRADGSRYSVEYDPAVHSKDDMKVSFLWNVIVQGTNEDGSDDEMKILQQGPQLFDQFIKQKDYMCWFTIKRTGSDRLDTEYSLTREGSISDNEVEAIKRMELHDLNKALDGDSQEQQQHPEQPRGGRRRSRSRTESSSTGSGGNGSGGNGSGGGLSKEQRATLGEVMKGLPDPRKAQGAFKTRFGISKLGELSPDQFDDAKTFLENIAKGEGDAPGEVDDPFFG